MGEHWQFFVVWRDIVQIESWEMIHKFYTYFLHICIQPNFKSFIEFVGPNISPHKSNGGTTRKMVFSNNPKSSLQPLKWSLLTISDDIGRLKNGR